MGEGGDPLLAKPASAADWIAAVNVFERDGTLFKAHDLAMQGLAEFPDAIWLRHRAVLCLARAGANELARKKFNELGLAAAEGEHDDIAALDARLLKDEALAATGAERRRKATVAADRYEAIYARTRNYYPGINAATLRLVAGEENLAESLARQVLAELRTGPEDDYYLYATQTEAAFLLGDIAAARRFIPRAIHANRVGGGDYSALASTWKQLRLVLELKGLDPKVVAAEFAPPHVIYFTGHRIAAPGTSGRLLPDEEQAVRERIDAHLEGSRVGHGYGSLSAGADILFAEALLRRSASLHVVLPFDLDEFVEVAVRPAGPDWVRRFEACIAAASTVRYATEDRYLGDDHLYNYCSRIGMGLAVLRTRHLASEVEQVAVWDGGPARGVAGTALNVARWRGAGLPQTIIPCGTYADLPPDNAPPVTETGHRVLRAMLFGDVKGFSKLNDVELPHFVEVLLGAVGRTLHSYDPFISFANTWGDGLFVVFEDVGQAARCALDLQAAMKRINLAEAHLPVHLGLRVGGHLGPAYAAHDPVLKKTNYFGAHVSRAARIEPVTPEDCVYVTETFAAALEFECGDEFGCDYVGMTESAKKYGAMRMFLLHRR
jgi:class 3 adenylate cyclase